MFRRMKHWLIGDARDISDPNLFHKVSLIAFMAWVGLGADGLSSSAYGPEEAFKAMTGHSELVIFMVLAMVFTVFIISYAYSRTIEHFPSGGGGYVVATKLLGAPFGVVSGCALLVDYVLTISVSIASGADQIWSFIPRDLDRHWSALPPNLDAWKLPFEAAAIVVLIIMNLRGVKESVRILVPIFLIFVASHIVLLLGAFLTHAGQLAPLVAQTRTGLSTGIKTLGFVALFKIFARAYAQGAGTYTGIEAVSNGVQIMREPRVPTAKRTMIYMAASLAVTAGGILLAYALVGATVQEGKTLNAVLAEKAGLGQWFVVLVLSAEAALLVIAAQTGFLDGPRVMANMAHDGWLPHRFSSLSDRLTMHYGIYIIGGSALATLFFTKGNTDQLVTMYSINVFITFSLTQLGMCRFWVVGRKQHPEWKRHLPVHLTGLVLCTAILALQILEKYEAGGKETAVITVGLILVCFLIRHYYLGVQEKVSLISSELLAVTPTPGEGSPAPTPPALDRNGRTAVLLVGGYNGLGVHSVLTIWRMFPNYYSQMVFLSAGVLDSGNFKGQEEVARLKDETAKALDKYIALAHRMGLAAVGRSSLGTDPVDECHKLCQAVSREFPRSTFFSGKLVFHREKAYHWLLHNQTAQSLQRRLEWEGISMIILPIRIRDEATRLRGRKRRKFSIACLVLGALWGLTHLHGVPPAWGRWGVWAPILLGGAALVSFFLWIRHEPARPAPPPEPAATQENPA
jgi:amino acid transporter